jgi:hypothetical protein
MSIDDLNTILISNITVGDILTFFAIIISAFKLTSDINYNMSRDRSLREKERADRIRNSAMSTLTKLDRWRELSKTIFQDVQPIFVDAIMMLSIEFDPKKTKNILWKEMIVANNQITWKILSENIQTPSKELLGELNRPDIRMAFESALIELQAARNQIFSNFIFDIQNDILLLEGFKKEEYRPNDLWNKMRGSIMRNQQEFEDRTKPTIEKMSDLLFGLVKLDDDKLLRD